MFFFFPSDGKLRYTIPSQEQAAVSWFLFVTLRVTTPSSPKAHRNAAHRRAIASISFSLLSCHPDVNKNASFVVYVFVCVCYVCLGLCAKVLMFFVGVFLCGGFLSVYNFQPNSHRLGNAWRFVYMLERAVSRGLMCFRLNL